MSGGCLRHWLLRASLLSCICQSPCHPCPQPHRVHSGQADMRNVCQGARDRREGRATARALPGPGRH